MVSYQSRFLMYMKSLPLYKEFQNTKPQGQERCGILTDALVPTCHLQAPYLTQVPPCRFSISQPSFSKELIGQFLVMLLQSPSLAELLLIKKDTLKGILMLNDCLFLLCTQFFCPKMVTLSIECIFVILMCPSLEEEFSYTVEELASLRFPLLLKLCNTAVKFQEVF